MAAEPGELRHRNLPLLLLQARERVIARFRPILNAHGITEQQWRIVRALIDHGVKHIFGYPGGAVLPIYDEIFQQDQVEHILVRHEQGAGHAAEGYARSTGKPAWCW
jgi:hypothetical protein